MKKCGMCLYTSVLGLQWCLAALRQLSVFTQVLYTSNYKYYCLENTTIYIKIGHMFQSPKFLIATLTVGTSKAITTPPPKHIFYGFWEFHFWKNKNRFSFIFQCLKWLEPRRINTDGIHNINHMLHIDHFTARLMFSAFKMKLKYVACR